MTNRRLPLAALDGGVRLAVRVTPRARRTELAGLVQDARGAPAFAVRLKAPPVDGAANLALLSFLADRLDVPKSALTIVSGHNARSKLVQVTGVTLTEIARRLESGAG